MSVYLRVGMQYTINDSTPPPSYVQPYGGIRSRVQFQRVLCGGGRGVVETEYSTLYITYTMEDKYIGLALALGGTFLIGSVHPIFSVVRGS